MHIKKEPFIGPHPPKVQPSHKRLGKFFWRKVIKEFDESSLSLKDFCSERTLAVSTFHGWHRRLFPAKAQTQKSQKKKGPSKAQFLPLYVTSPENAPQELKDSSSRVFKPAVNSLPNSAGLNLHLNENLKISIDKDFHGPTLKRLMGLLSSQGGGRC